MYLGSSVPFEGDARVRLAHALAVVDHLYEGSSGILDHDLYAVRTCVDGVFHQLFDDGGRPLDHLSGCYLVRYGIR